MPGRCSFQSLKAVSGEPVLSPTHSSSAWAAGAHRCGGWQAPEARGQTRGCESDEDFRPQHESVPTPRRTVPSGGGGSGSLSPQSGGCLPASPCCVHPGGLTAGTCPVGPRGVLVARSLGPQQLSTGGTGPAPTGVPPSPGMPVPPNPCPPAGTACLPGPSRVVPQPLPLSPLAPQPFPHPLPPPPRPQHHVPVQTGLHSAPSQLSTQTTVDKWVIKAKSKQSIKKKWWLLLRTGVAFSQ